MSMRKNLGSVLLTSTLSTAIASTSSITPITKTSALNPGAAMGGILGGCIGGVTIARVSALCGILAECVIRDRTIFRIGDTGFRIGFITGEVISVTIGALIGNKLANWLGFSKDEKHEKDSKKETENKKDLEKEKHKTDDKDFLFIRVT